MHSQRDFILTGFFSSSVFGLRFKVNRLNNRKNSKLLSELWLSKWCAFGFFPETTRQEKSLAKNYGSKRIEGGIQKRERTSLSMLK